MVQAVVAATSSTCRTAGVLFDFCFEGLFSSHHSHHGETMFLSHFFVQQSLQRRKLWQEP